jgi:hypothetical protein
MLTLWLATGFLAGESTGWVVTLPAQPSAFTSAAGAVPSAWLSEDTTIPSSWAPTAAPAAAWSVTPDATPTQWTGG